MSESTIRLHLPPVFYARIPLANLRPVEMDKALAAGYYRNGSELSASSVRYMSQSWTSSVMLRLPLEGFAFKKRHRKLLRVNSDRFTVNFQPFQASADMEALWQRYKSTIHQWATVPVLEQHLLRGNAAEAFGMWQLTVHDGTKLVAFTAFDMGREGLASLEAAYDPDYSSFSLGFYTMLLEIQHCLELGMKFYYPGFLPKDDPMFKYKLRPGELHFFRLKTKEWLPVSELAASDWLFDDVTDRLLVMKTLLQVAGVPVIDGFSHCVSLPDKRPKLNSFNVHLIVPLEVGGIYFLLFVAWDPIAEVYRVFEGQALQPELTLPLKPSHFFYGVQQLNNFGQFSKAEDVVLLAQRFGEYR